MFRTLDTLGIAGRVVSHRHTWLTRSSRVGRNARKRRRFPDNQGILPARETSFFHQGYFLTPPPQLLTRQKPSSRWKLGGKRKRGSAIYFYNRSLPFLRCFSSDTERIDSICSIESEKEGKGKKIRDVTFRVLNWVRHWEKKNLWLMMMETDVFLRSS